MGLVGSLRQTEPARVGSSSTAEEKNATLELQMDELRRSELSHAHTWAYAGGSDLVWRCLSMDINY